MKISINKSIKQIILTLLVCTSGACNIAFAVEGNANGFFNDANSFFQKNIVDGGVDYQALQNNDADLKKLVASMASMDLSKFSKNEQKAFWINAYNLTVINSIIQNWPINSPMDVNGFFDQKKHLIANKKLTINTIENKKLRTVYNDPRVHFVLVCAAMGCPKIIAGAYFPDKLELQLEAQTKSTLNDPYFIRIYAAGKKVLISEIFKWYKADFTGMGKSVVEYINQYRKNKIPVSYRVGYYTYDWTLNNKKKPISMKPKVQVQPAKKSKEVAPKVQDQPAKKMEEVAPKVQDQPAKKMKEIVPEEQVELPHKSEAIPVLVEEIKSKDEKQPLLLVEQVVYLVADTTPEVEDQPSQKAEDLMPEGPSRPLRSEQPINLQEYTPSALLKPGQIEVKLFNNLYTDKASFDENGDIRESSRRQNYFSSFLQTSYGLAPKLNIGIDVIFKSVSLDDDVTSSPFALFAFQNTSNTRTAISYIGPKIKFSPFKKLSGLSVQSTFFIPLASDQQGLFNDKPYLSFDGYQWWVQLFYDQKLSDKFRAFFELDAISYIDRAFEQKNSSLDTPVKGFLSYFLTPKTTLYLLTEWAPTWGEGGIPSYYSQVGVGGKYQLTSNLEIELLYTDFPLGKNKGAGTTYNLGFRFLR